MKVTECRLAHMAADPGGYPQDGRPQVAFLGRSNVGKSSLINCLLRRRRLAHTSGTPGKTRTLNFYLVNRKLYLVDMPGYGYAKAARRDSADWRRRIGVYLRHGDALVGLVQLIDARHPPTRLDRRVAAWLAEAGVARIVAATKADKLRQRDRRPAIERIRADLELATGEPIVLFSAVRGTGRDELWRLLLDRAETEP